MSKGKIFYLVHYYSLKRNHLLFCIHSKITKIPARISIPIPNGPIVLITGCDKPFIQLEVINHNNEYHYKKYNL